MRPLTGCFFTLLLFIVSYPSRASTEQLRYYDVCINGNCSSAVAVLAIQDDQWLIDAQAIHAFGIDIKGWPIKQSDGLDYVNLAEQFPALKISFEEATQSLQINLPAQAWPENFVGRKTYSSRPVTVPSRIPSAFANYSIHVGTESPTSGYGEAGVVYGPWQLRSTFSISEHSGFQRGLTAIEFDQPEHQRRWVFGDQYLSPRDAFGMSTRMLGFGIFRAYDLTPAFVSSPGIDMRGVMQAPGSIDVYSNGNLVAHEELGPGPFSLRDLVLPRGYNNLRLVIHDPFAGTYELSDAFYSSARLLKQGQHEFDDRIGWIANASQAECPEYGSTLVSLKHRYGFNDFFTAGFRFEQFEGRRNTGASFDVSTGVGALSTSIAQSRDAGLKGIAWNLDYSYETRYMAIGLGLRKQTEDYRPLLMSFDSIDSTFPSEAHYANLSFPIGKKMRVGTRYSEQRYNDDSQARNLGINLGWRMSPRLQATLVFNRSTGVVENNELALNLRMALSRDSFNMMLSHRNDSFGYQLGAQRSAPADYGWGYRADISGYDSTHSARAGLDLNSRFGRSYLVASSIANNTTVDLYHSGGFLWAEGDLFATRPGSVGYALVQANAADVPVLHENLPAGYTNKDGRALVSGLLPYQSNLVSLDIDKLEAGIQIDENRQYVNVPRNGVALVPFNLRDTRSVQAFLNIRRGDISQRLRYGDAYLDTHDKTSMIGQEGQVYFEDVAPGRHVVFASNNGARFVCEINVPVDAGMSWLGEVTCQPE